MCFRYIEQLDLEETDVLRCQRDGAGKLKGCPSEDHINIGRDPLGGYPGAPGLANPNVPSFEAQELVVAA